MNKKTFECVIATLLFAVVCIGLIKNGIWWPIAISSVWSSAFAGWMLKGLNDDE